jgi:hypothetical protein
VAGIAERGELVTVLARQGEQLTRATYLIKANKKQFLAVVLPEGAQLWSCIVDGQSVKPVDGPQRQLMIPLATSSDVAQAIPVELVYFERAIPLSGMGRLALQGPVLDVPTTVANWFVYAPKALQLLRVWGNLERGAAAVDFLEEPFRQLAQDVESKDKDQSWSMNVVSGLGRAGSKRQLSKEGKAPTEESYQDEQPYASSAPSSSPEYTATGPPVAGVAGGMKEDLREVVEGLTSRLQETGVLPLKIRLPKSGRLYRFNRLMTTQEALELNATFVHLSLPWLSVVAVALLLPIGGVVALRLRRRTHS